jgi:hypothetical protein
MATFNPLRRTLSKMVDPEPLEALPEGEEAVPFPSASIRLAGALQDYDLQADQPIPGPYAFQGGQIFGPRGEQIARVYGIDFPAYLATGFLFRDSEQIEKVTAWLLEVVKREVAAQPMWPGNLPDSTAHKRLREAEEALAAAVGKGAVTPWAHAPYNLDNLKPIPGPYVFEDRDDIGIDDNIQGPNNEQIARVFCTDVPAYLATAHRFVAAPALVRSARWLLEVMERELAPRLAPDDPLHARLQSAREGLKAY